MGVRAFRNVGLALFIVVVALLLNYHKNIIQSHNIDIVVSEDLDERLALHRINRLDKLQSIIADGIRSVEIDLLFRRRESGAFFEVGHDEADASGIRVDRFLDLLQSAGARKLWLDIKNLREDNLDAMLAEFERLDSSYAIRRRTIIESGITGAVFRRVGASGFHTSYYLPTGTLLRLLKSNDHAKLSEEASRLNAQIESQHLSAISFNSALYPFVKMYLEPIIPDNVVYHTWDTIKLWELNAIEELKQTDYFRDPRVKTMLVRHWG